MSRDCHVWYRSIGTDVDLFRLAWGKVVSPGYVRRALQP